jgi:hypothetical protein
MSHGIFGNYLSALQMEASMKRRVTTVCISVLSLTAAFIAGTAFGQQTPRGRTAPPAQNEGSKTDILATIDLGPEFPSMQGYELRMTRTATNAGGAGPMHGARSAAGTPHIPACVHVLQGTVTEHRDDGKTTDFPAASTWCEGKAVTHWVENRGTTSYVWILASIRKKDPQ